MKARHADTRQHLLDTGYRLMTAKGFTNVGLSDLLATAGIPKGSFYHYFDSKMHFGQVMLEDYFSAYVTQMSALFANPEMNGRECLFQFWQNWQTGYCEPSGANQCLAVKLAAEVADFSEPMRLALFEGMNKIIDCIASCIQRGQQDGSLQPFDARQTATILYQQWLGASLVFKIRRDDQPLLAAMLLTRKLLGD